MDTQVRPLPSDGNSHDAVSFIGVLTYFETDDILTVLYRLARPKGHVVLSQRDDMMRERDNEAQFREIEDMGSKSGCLEPSL